MQKYFKKEQPLKISLQQYWLQVDREWKTIEKSLEKHSASGFISKLDHELIEDLKSKKRELSLKHARIKHIYKSLGDILISEEMIDTICRTFDISKCRYGAICLKTETVQSIYQISEMFPELTKEALLMISREYIKDLFDEYALLETLSIMIRKYGMEDTTFEKFMFEVTKKAEKEERRYADVAWHIRIYCGEYTYKFVKHFEKFVKEHHISWERFCESLPSPEIVLKDQMELKLLASMAKDCWQICEPITFQMLEDYLDGDTELSSYEEQPIYYISTSGKKIEVPFTKTDFLKSIQDKQEILKRK